MEAVIPVEDRQFSTPFSNILKLEPTNLMASAIASCHSLTLNEQDEAVGYHIDLKMFQDLDWVCNFFYLTGIKKSVGYQIERWNECDV